MRRVVTLVPVNDCDIDLFNTLDFLPNGFRMIAVFPDDNESLPARI